MKVLVGLGNPGTKYQNTRHNVGFLVLDELAREHKFPAWQSEKRFEAEMTKGAILGESFYLVKPQTFMNLSGQSVAALCNYYKIQTSDLIVVFDDVDLAPGAVKARRGGGHGGHNGIRDLLEKLPDGDFHRIKFGIGKPQFGEVRDWVLAKLSQDELEHLTREGIKEVLIRLRSILLQGKSSD